MERIIFTKDQRATLYAAPIAFTLSLLIGILSGNPIGVVMVRAIVSALLFSALLYGGLYLLRRYVPELGENSTSESAAVHTEVSSGEMGRRVDFTISEPAGGPGAVEVGDARSADAAAESESSEVGSETGGAEHKPAVSRLSDVPGESELDGMTLDSLEGENEQEDEELPSLDRLFEEHEQEALPDIKPSSSAGKRHGTVTGKHIKVGDASIPYDPEVLAKAVKKVMKQDE